MPSTLQFTRTFSQLGKNDAPIAGGKGASLGEMTQAGIPVPPGFVVLADTFEQYLEKTNIASVVDTILKTVDHTNQRTVDQASTKIQALILDQNMPEDIQKEISNEFKNLGTEYVAIRSSATAEDGADNAWAGQLDSYLNTKEADVLDKVKHCWASLFTACAIFYRFEKGLGSAKISVAVVVQKMINSEISGIAFSVHPVTEDRNQMIIEAGFGLGEAIVSGSITPDSYIVSKEPRTIVETTIATHEKALVRNLEGGNVWIQLKGENVSAQILNEQQILELSELIMKIETHYGFPCDIEWAYEAGKFYIVQSRPITTLSNSSQKLIPSSITNFKEFIARQHLISLGNRGADIHEATWKIKGWSTLMRKEFGVGYKVMLFNSLGEQYGDRESRDEIDRFFEGKDISMVREYIDKLATLNQDVLQKLEQHPRIDYTEEFARMMMYFIVVRWVIEDIYEKVSDEDREYINAWRNNTKLFTSFEKFDEVQEQSSPVKNDWSLIGVNDEITKVDELITYKTHSLTTDVSEVTGTVGYAGKISGKVRVALTKEERDTIQEGEIIVARMTTIDFLPAMKKAIAFVTDEGGVTCHAAIVAREMKKPCVIGTRIATKVFKTGDIVEIDVINGKGIVRIIS